MRTLPTIFSDRKHIVDMPVTPVVVIDNGVTTWLFSYIDMHVNFESAAVDVYGALLSDPAPRSGVNLFSRITATSSITVQLSNRYQIGTANEKPSDVLTDIYGASVKVYYLLGEIPNNVEDGLCVFNGSATAEPFFDKDRVTIQVETPPAGSFPLIPTRMSDIDDDAFAAFDSNKVAPFVRGHAECDTTWLGNRSEAGTTHADPIFAPAVAENKWILYDGELTATANVTTVLVWIPLLGMFVEVPSTEYTITLDDSGRTTLVFDNFESVHCHIHVKPDRMLEPIGGGGDAIITYQDTTSPTTLLQTGFNNFIDFEKAFDGDGSTYATLVNGSLGLNDPADDAAQKGLAIFGFPDIYQEKSCGLIVLDEDHVDVIYRADVGDVGTYTREYGVGPYASMVAYTHPASAYISANGASSWDDDTVRTLNIGASLNFVTDVGLKLATGGARVYMSSQLQDTNYTGSSVTALGSLLIKDVEIRIGCQMNLKALKASVWWHGYGPTVGTTIGSRDAISAISDVNHYPVTMIEAILRDSCGLATADIDTDSFDALFSFDYIMQLVIDGEERIRADELIQEICENCHLVVHFDYAGKVRLGEISPTAPSPVNAIFKLSELLELPKLSYTDRTQITNAIDMSVKFRRGGTPISNATQIFKQLSGVWVKTLAPQGPHTVNLTGHSVVLSNPIVLGDRSTVVPSRDGIEAVYLVQATSVAKYGTRTATADMRYMRKDFLKSSTPLTLTLNKKMLNLLASQHEIVHVMTAGMKYAALEVFDWFELDGTTVDPIVLHVGATWTGEKYMIIEKQYTEDGIRFTGIQIQKLYGDV